MLSEHLSNNSYANTASSSVSDAVSARVPILSSKRLVRGHSYLAPPAIIMRNITTPDLTAIRSMRGSKSRGLAGGKHEWNALHTHLREENALSLAKIFK
jgi:hypothetical protein